VYRAPRHFTEEHLTANTGNSSASPVDPSLEPDLVLSVVVCTYNREELLQQCLESLAEQTLDRERYEVIVVDNNSTDKARDIATSFAERHRHFKVVHEAQQGISHARNLGWREARGQFVAYADDDTEAAPDWCERILAAFTTVSPQPVALGGKILPRYEVMPPSWFCDDFEMRSWGDTAGFLQPPQAAYGFSGANMSFTKDVLQEFGGFSPRYGCGTGESTGPGEETDLFLRIYSTHPLFWYDPRMLVYHWTPQRCLTVSYRLYRSFKGGESIAQMVKARVLSASYLFTLVTLLWLVATTPIALFASGRKLRSAAVRRAEELAGKIGYLFGSFPD